MYTVWAEGVAQSIPLSLDDAKEFALETNMLAFVVDTNNEYVWSVSQCEYSRFFKD